MDLEDVSHIQEFGEMLGEIGIDRTDVCLFGSTTLALYGLRSNGDIDFIATPTARKKIQAFARKDPNSEVISGIRTHIGDHIELLIEDRLDATPYTFGLDDTTVIKDPAYHIEVDGFRFVRPELILSMKAAKRRPKDRDDIRLIQESGLTETSRWDWDYVYIIPPWERQFSTAKRGVRGRIKESLPYHALTLLLDDGLQSLIEKSREFFAPTLRAYYHQSDRIPIKLARIYETGTRFRKPVVDDLEYRYPVPQLISRQFNDEGRFERFDLIADLLAAENLAGSPRPADTPYQSDASIVVSTDGKLISGQDLVISRLIGTAANLPRSAPEVTLPVEISRSHSKPAFLDEQTTDSHDEDHLLKRKQDLLIETGAAFYAILWPGAQGYFDEIETLVRSKATVLDKYEFELAGEFEDFVQRVYAADERNQAWFRDNKLAELKEYEPTMRVLVLEIPNPAFEMNSGYQVCTQSYDLKMACRREFQELIDDYVYGTVIHTTDNFKHNAHLGHLLTQLLNE